MKKRKGKLRPAKGRGCGQSFTDHNLMGVNPLSQQFEPTEGAPIRQNKRMAGVS